MPIQPGFRMQMSAAADMHCHLRQGAIANLVVPLIRQGGCDTVFVMPNLQPPLVSVPQVVEYKKQLESINPHVRFLVSLYLTKDTTPQTILDAKKAGIHGVKYYPKGTTTNSEFGIDKIEDYFSVFQEMENQSLVLNLHGEVPASPHVSVLNAERHFIPTLKTIHNKFPRLKIVLEHCTTKEAVDAVLECGNTVAATITAHHLYMTVDDWCNTPVNFCKPVAKTQLDRACLIKAATSKNPKFFLGTDSAPHLIEAKSNPFNIAAGCFTQPYAVQLIAKVFDQHDKVDCLEDFCSIFGRNFYGIEKSSNQIEMSRQSDIHIPKLFGNVDTPEQIIPFQAGQELMWTVTWLD